MVVSYKLVINGYEWLLRGLDFLLEEALYGPLCLKRDLGSVYLDSARRKVPRFDNSALRPSSLWQNFLPMCCWGEKAVWFFFFPA